MTPPVEPSVTRRPRNAVVILLDSLNRHMVGAYGGREFATPNLDRFAAGASRFQRDPLMDPEIMKMLYSQG